VSNITIDQLADAITAQLSTFEKSVRDGVKKAVDETMDEMVKDTKSTAQVRSGRYKRSIATAAGDNTAMKYSKVWHVKNPDYRRAHLLDKGHKFRNGERYPGNQHVANARDHAAETFQRKLEEVIRDAGS
jgi:hypothetical protein